MHGPNDEREAHHWNRSRRTWNLHFAPLVGVRIQEQRGRESGCCNRLVGPCCRAAGGGCESGAGSGIPASATQAILEFHHSSLQGCELLRRGRWSWSLVILAGTLSPGTETTRWQAFVALTFVFLARATSLMGFSRDALHLPLQKSGRLEC
jgi:hypothetical protein